MLKPMPEKLANMTLINKAAQIYVFYEIKFSLIILSGIQLYLMTCHDTVKEHLLSKKSLKIIVMSPGGHCRRLLLC